MRDDSFREMIATIHREVTEKRTITSLYTAILIFAGSHKNCTYLDVREAEIVQEHYGGYYDMHQRTDCFKVSPEVVAELRGLTGGKQEWGWTNEFERYADDRMWARRREFERELQVSMAL